MPLATSFALDKTVPRRHKAEKNQMFSASIKYIGPDPETNRECPAIVQGWLTDEIDWKLVPGESSSALNGRQARDEFIQLVASRDFCEKST
jgi:hypothetical protein